MIVNVETKYAKVKFKGTVDEIVEVLKRMGLSFSDIQKIHPNAVKKTFKDIVDTRN